MAEQFTRLAGWLARQAGSWWFIALSFVLFVVWIALGPWSDWSEGWNFAGNQPLTVLSYFTGLLVLNTAFRTEKAIQLKLDELVLRLPGPRDEVAGSEELPEPELERLKAG